MDYIKGKNEAEPYEQEVWTVATGNFPSPFAPRSVKKRSREAIRIINACEGFCGYHPVEGRGTLCLFETENDAKAARNIMRSHGIPVGDNICKVFVPKEAVEITKKQLAEFNAKQKGKSK